MDASSPGTTYPVIHFPPGCSRAEAIARVTDWLDSFLGAEATRAAARLSTPDERRQAYAALAQQRADVLANVAAALDGIDRPGVAQDSGAVTPQEGHVPAHVATPTPPPPPGPVVFRCRDCDAERVYSRDELDQAMPWSQGVIPWSLACPCGSRMRRVMGQLR